MEYVLLEIIRKENDRNFEATDLLEALCEEGLLVWVFDEIIKAYGSVGMFNETIDLLFYTNHRGYGWFILSCHFFLSKLVECEKVDSALALYQRGWG